MSAEEAAAGVLTAQALARTGGGRAALGPLYAAMRAAKEAQDPRLALSVARAGAVLARRLDAPAQADLYVQIAREEAVRVRELERAEAGAPRVLASNSTVHEKTEMPFGLYSQRSSVAAFRARVKNDPEYLAGLTHLKKFRDDPADTIVGTLEAPGVHVDPPRFFADDYRTLGQALSYYKFVLNLSDTIDDRFGLAVLYVNLTVLQSNDHPVLKWVYGATKGAAIVEAITRIVSFHVTGTPLDLTILALDKLVIDVIQRYEHPERKSSDLPLFEMDED